MLSAVCFTVICILAALAVTRKRVFIVAGFYCFYALLTVIGEGDVPHLGPITLYRALYLIVLISLAARLIQDRALPDQMRKWPLWQYSFLVALVLASALYSQTHRVYSSDDTVWSNLVVMALFVVAASHIQGDADLGIFAATTAAVAITLSVWLVWSLARMNFEALRGGTEANANYVSLFVFAGALALIPLLFSAKRWFFKLFCFAGLLCTVVAGLILASRGMMAAFAGAAVITMAKLARKRGQRMLWAAGMVLLLAMAIAVALPGETNFFLRFQGDNLGTLNDRTVVWSESLEHFTTSSLARMVFGQGLSSASFILGPHLTSDLINYHNQYLKFFMEQGILGFLAFAVFLFAIIKQISGSQHPLKHLMVGWLAFLLIAGLSSTIADFHFFWLLLGAVAGSCAQVDQTRMLPATAMTKATPTLPLPSTTTPPVEGSA